MGIWFAAPVEHWPHYNARTPTIVSATNEDAFFPATNMLTYDPTQVFRSTAGSTTIVVNVQGDGVGIPDFDVMSLLYTNMSYRATYTVAVSTDGSVFNNVTGAVNIPVWASLTGVQPASLPDPGGGTDDPRYHSLRRNHSLVYKPAGNYTHVRFTITDPLVTNITIGRIFFGKRFTPTYSWQYGSSFAFIDYGRQDRTERGVLVLDPGRTLLAANVKMDFLTKAEMYDFVYEFNLFLGASREFLACLDDQDTARLQKNLLYCTISEGRMVSFESFNNHSVSWVLESIS